MDEMPQIGTPQITDEEFEEAIAQALDEMPAQFTEAMENVAVVMADEPTQEEWDSIDDDGQPAGTRAHDSAAPREGELLGLYTGVPITERYFGEFEGEAPDVITIFKHPHERCFHTHDAILAQVKRTVIHEIGHYFGLDDERLHEMGY